MTKEQEQAMNDVTVYQARILNTSCGMVTIIGNGQVVDICDEEDAEYWEARRCEYGY